MIDPRRVVFVGQGPNRHCWTDALIRAHAHGAADPDGYARELCRRLSVTGAVGGRLAAMLGLDVGSFMRRYPRRNLNARWLGKSGRGDAFDSVEGREAARAVAAEGFDRHVLLGTAVCECFGVEHLPLCACQFDSGKLYLCFPHPSGLNQWWNSAQNRFAAHDALRAFLGVN